MKIKTMGFPQLPIGQRFSFDSRVYAKTGPLTASDQVTGKQRLMRKSAQVTPLNDPQQVMESAKPRPIGEDEMQARLSSYRSSLKRAVIELAGRQAQLNLDDVLRLIDMDLSED